MGHSTKKLDLTGQRYGELTVLRPADNVGGRTAWLCRCSCGRETVVKTCHLRNGHTKSCGCKNAAGNPRAALGLTGVDWWTSKRRWRAAICFKGKRYYLGSYGRFEDAVKARKRAEEELHDGFLREFAAETAEKAVSG